MYILFFTNLVGLICGKKTKNMYFIQKFIYNFDDRILNYDN